MSRTISASAQGQVNAAQTGSCWLTIIKIKHADLDDDICVVNNTEPVVFGGVTFQPYAFKFTPPRQVEGQMQPSKITIDNVTQEISLALRQMVSPPTIETAIIMVMPNGTTTKEAGWWIAELSNVFYDAFQITANISFNISVRNIISSVTYNTLDFPGLY